jgi:maltokinase
VTATTSREPAEQVLGYITSARWFAGKGRRAELAGLTPLPWLTGTGEWPAVRFEVAEIRYPESTTSTELYQLAMSYRQAPEPGLEQAEIGSFELDDAGPVVAYDATRDPQACRLVMDRLLGEGTATTGDSRVGFHLVSGDALSVDLEPHVFTGQQSNTSVMYGDVAMLKLFRRLEIGHNLDIEVHESLSRSGVGDVARLYGYVDASWTGSNSRAGAPLVADLAMVVEKLADAEDGWELALTALREGRDFSDRARDLGRALAEIHEALRAEFPTAEVSGARTAAVMQDRLAVAAEVAPELTPLTDGLHDCFDALSQTRLATQRVHGDFHLGQTLYTPGGWKIIDFEGEPVKSLAERAEPDSVWRDIAGMLRSFDYAAASVPGEDSRAWADACRAAFLSGYAGGDLGADDAAVLRAYEADKAVYEVVYETRNRPDWVGIPLAAVSAIASSTPQTASAPPNHINRVGSAAQVKE